MLLLFKKNKGILLSLQEKLVNIRKSKWFSNLTTSVIIFYSCILGLKTISDIDSNFSFLLSLFDYFVTLYFIVEIVIKISAEKNIKDFFKSGWNIFDFAIVLITLIPMDNSSLAATFRLLRIFRVLRLITSRPELKKIIDMLISAIPSIVDIVILMFIIFYIYAIVGNFLFADAPSGLWKDFLISMLTLFRIMTFEDWTDVMYEGMEIYPYSWIYFVSFVVITAFVLFNLFIAVIIGEMEKINNKDKNKEDIINTNNINKILVSMEELKQEIKELKNQK
jgi:voltage-gated sodium channel